RLARFLRFVIAAARCQLLRVLVRFLSRCVVRVVLVTVRVQRVDVMLSTFVVVLEMHFVGWAMLCGNLRAVFGLAAQFALGRGGCLRFAGGLRRAPCVGVGELLAVVLEWFHLVLLFLGLLAS